jgi:hypothetical protein
VIPTHQALMMDLEQFCVPPICTSALMVAFGRYQLDMMDSEEPGGYKGPCAGAAARGASITPLGLRGRGAELAQERLSSDWYLSSIDIFHFLTPPPHSFLVYEIRLRFPRLLIFYQGRPSTHPQRHPLLTRFPPTLSLHPHLFIIIYMR